MSPLLVAQLVVQFGIPLTQQIINWTHSGKTEVTPEDFAQLVALSEYRSADALAVAGIKLVDGKVVQA